MPNQPTPQSRRRGQSRLAGHVRGRRKTSTPSATDATRRRPSDRAPGGTSRPRCRIATKADAHSRSVTATAERTSHFVRRSSVKAWDAVRESTVPPRP